MAFWDRRQPQRREGARDAERHHGLGERQLRRRAPRVAQAPFAAILCCADSRVSPPLVFDVERGNLFAAHVAGNSVDTGTLGSIEFAVAVLKVPLVMVLGHSDCGAVKAALAVAHGTAAFPPATHGAIGAVVDRIVPAVRDVPEEALARATVANARAQAALLRGSEPILAPAVRRGDLRVVAAVYRIGSGRVSLV